MADHTPFRKALVTGAAGELGTELCRNLSAMGTAIVAVDIDGAGLDALAEGFGNSVSVDTCQADMCDHEAFEARLKEIAESHPDIDVLFANAGIDRPQRAEDLDWRIAKRHFDINTTANYVLLSVFLPRFIQRGAGHVVATISLGALAGMPYEHAYNGSKSAMHRIIDGLRAELKPRGVTFTSVFPSYLEGKMATGNAFRVNKATPMGEAVKRIVDAAVQRRAHLKFPWFDTFQIFVLGLLPLRLRDAVSLGVMDSEFGRH
jgi:short-subunit dehydrogenase